MPRNIAAPSARRPQSMRLRFSPRVWASREKLKSKFREAVEEKHLELNPKSTRKPQFVMEDVDNGGFQITAVVNKRRGSKTSGKIKLPKAVREIIREFNNFSLDHLIEMDNAKAEARKEEERELADAIRRAQSKGGATGKLVEAIHPDVLAKMAERGLIVLPGGKADKPAGQTPPVERPAVA